MLSLYVDPSAGGWFHLDKWVASTLLLHLSYSSVTYLALRYGASTKSVRTVSTGLDLTFATAITLLTEGRTSPSFIFFVFAIVAVGFRTAFRDTLLITGASVTLYIPATALAGGIPELYPVRALYLAIAGYLIGFFGQQRVDFEKRLRELKAAAERQTIARSLHDGYIQALAGISLRLESCRDMVASEQPEEALAEVREVQMALTREYDEVREYVHSLVDAESSAGNSLPAAVDTEFRLDASLVAKGALIEHLFQIMLEGVRNTRRHGQALSASINATSGKEVIHLTIDDNGVGFGGSPTPPWTVASRVAEIGGTLALTENGPGARLEIVVPVA